MIQILNFGIISFIVFLVDGKDYLGVLLYFFILYASVVYI